MCLLKIGGPLYRYGGCANAVARMFKARNVEKVKSFRSITLFLCLTFRPYFALYLMRILGLKTTSLYNRCCWKFLIQCTAQQISSSSALSSLIKRAVYSFIQMSWNLNWAVLGAESFLFCIQMHWFGKKC